MTISNNQQVVNVMRTAVEQGIKSGAKIEYRFGEVASMDSETASVFLDGNTSASTGFRIPVEMELDVGDHVRVAIASGSNLGKWVEEIMQCDDRQTDTACSRVVRLLPAGLDTNMSVGHGHSKRVYFSDGTQVARYRANLELNWHIATSDGLSKIQRQEGLQGVVLKGTAGFSIYTGNELWDIGGSVTGTDFALCEPEETDKFWLSTTGSLLQRRNLLSGALLESVALTSEGLSLRRTPTGTYVAVRQGTGTIKIYTKGLDLEQTINITGFFPCNDWNVDEAFNLYRLSSAGVLTKYKKTGTLLWTVDLAATQGYKWPTRQSTGNGNQLIVDDFVRVVGYKGNADWLTGSEALLLTITRATGDVKMVQRFGGNTGDGAQAMAVHRSVDCLYIAGAATGNNFEEQALDGIRGFAVRVGEFLVGGGDSGGEGGTDPSHTHTMSLDDLTDVETSSPYTPSNNNVLTYSSAYGLWIPAASAGGGESGVDVHIRNPVTGVASILQMKFAGTFTSWTVLNDTGGSIQFDLWKDTYANYPPTVADTITASDKPKTVSVNKNTGTCTGWTTSFVAGDVINVNIDSVSGVLYTTLALRMTRT